MSITWHNPATTPPPANVEILLAVITEPDEATAGYHLPAQRAYRVMDEGTIPEARVYAWARLPAPPSPEKLFLRPRTPHHCPRCGKLRLTRLGRPHVCPAAETSRK